MNRNVPSATLVALSCAAAWSCASDRSARDGSPAPDAPRPATEVAAYRGRAMESAAAPKSIPVATDPAVDSVWDYLVSRYDGDGNGLVTPREYTRDQAQFERWDRNGDGALDASDFARDSEGPSGGGAGDMRVGRARRMLARYFQQDDDPRILTLAEAADAFELYDGGDGSADDGLAAQEGRPAPDFTLATPDGDRTYTLSSFRGDRPVALIFGSYT